MRNIQKTIWICFILLMLCVPGWSQNAIRDVRNFSVSANPTVSVSDISGEIRVVGEKISEVRVIAEKTDPKIEILMEQTGNRVRIEVRYPEHAHRASRWFGGSESSGDVNIQIAMPEEGNLEARTVSGDAMVENLQGDLTVKAVSGDLKLRKLGKRLLANTVSGDIQVEQVTGEMEMKTVSGDLRATNLNGRLTMSSVSGDLDIRSSNLTYMALESTSGDVDVVTPLSHSGSYSISSHSGDVTLSIPRNSSFRVTSETFSGDFSSDFDLPTTEINTERRRGQRISATYGTGDADVRLRTFSGSVRLGIQ